MCTQCQTLPSLGNASEVINTHFQESFRPHSAFSWPATYNRSEAVSAINRASIHLADSNASPLAGFSTTASRTYQRPSNPGRTIPVIRFPRNTSSFPQGDLDPLRVKERINHTTTGTVHAEPPPNSYPHHVDGSDLHTLSSVHLGGSPFYRYSTCGSTMSRSYPPISAPTVRVRAPEKDSIPFDYSHGIALDVNH